MRNALVVTLAAALASAPAAAQEVLPPPPAPAAALPLSPGTRVRLTQASGGQISGFLAGMSDRTLAIALPSENPIAPPPRLEVPLGSVSRLEVFTGKRHFAKVGIVAGLLVGAALGAAVDIDPHGECGMTDTDDFCSKGEAIGISAAVGALFGGLIGFAVRQERWTPVAIEALGAPPDVGRMPEPVALTASVSLRF